MKGILAKRGRQCSSLERAIDKVVSNKDATEKGLKEVEARWKRAVEEKLAAKSAEEGSRAEADSLARRVSDLESELAILRLTLRPK